METMTQAADFFAQVPNQVNREKIQGMNATYQFNITGANGGQWWVRIADGDATVGERPTAQTSR
jgi:hypothetical protein